MKVNGLSLTKYLAFTGIDECVHNNNEEQNQRVGQGRKSHICVIPVATHFFPVIACTAKNNAECNQEYRKEDENGY